MGSLSPLSSMARCTCGLALANFRCCRYALPEKSARDTTWYLHVRLFRASCSHPPHCCCAVAFPLAPATRAHALETMQWLVHIAHAPHPCCFGWIPAVRADTARPDFVAPVALLSGNAFAPPPRDFVHRLRALIDFLQHIHRNGRSRTVWRLPRSNADRRIGIEEWTMSLGFTTARSREVL